MAIFRHSAPLPGAARGCVVAIGNFDGLHLGHRVVLERTRELAAGRRACSAVLTFEPHPLAVLRPETPPFRITPLRAKVHALESTDIDHLYIMHFDTAFASQSAESFVRDLLVRDLQVACVVVGWDFCFGHKRKGDVALLRSMGEDLGFDVAVLDPVSEGTGYIYSSSKIREFLREGRPRDAARLLGRAFEIEGRVMGGDRRGRTLGFPTANIALDDYLRPAFGVYAVAVSIAEDQDQVWYPGVANLGNRPTVEGTREQLEVHLFDFARDIYGTHVRVRLIEFLRGERKFASLDELKAQISADCDSARRLHAEQDG